MMTPVAASARAITTLNPVRRAGRVRKPRSELPKSAQTQQDEWTVTSGPDAKPGSWGGHCVNLVDYTSDGPTCVTWGRTMPMTWQFFDKYCDEAYAAISPDFLGEGEKNRAASSGHGRTDPQRSAIRGKHLSTDGRNCRTKDSW